MYGKKQSSGIFKAIFGHMHPALWASICTCFLTSHSLYSEHPTSSLAITRGGMVAVLIVGIFSLLRLHSHLSPKLLMAVTSLFTDIPFLLKLEKFSLLKTTKPGKETSRTMSTTQIIHTNSFPK